MVAKSMTTEPGSSPNGVAWTSVNTPEVADIVRVGWATSAANEARSPP
jgi:hypothetical protein